MKKQNIISKLFLAVFALVVISYGCQPQSDVQPKGNTPGLTALGPGDTIHQGPDTICGSIVSGDFINSLGQSGSGNIFGADLFGSWDLMATPQEIVWQFTLGRGWFVNKWWGWADNATNIPVDPVTNEVILEQFPFQNTVNPVRNYAEVRVPVTANNTCPNSSDFALCLELVELDFLGNPYNNTIVWAQGTPLNTLAGQVISFCATPCGSNTGNIPCNITSGAYRTQTQGGWGSRANGSNPGAYRDANWAAAFPNGLTVGCSSNSISLSSSAAVEDLLPCGGPAKTLTQSYTDPSRVQNVLVGQLIAAKLSVGFDNASATFGTSAQKLGNLVLESGDFAGWSVNALIAEADQVLGGCSSASNARDLNNALSQVNENFVDGTLVGTFLGCPTAAK